MGWLGWTAVFAGLVVLAGIALTLLGLRVWRAVKALGRDVARAGELMSSLPTRAGLSDSD